MIVKTYTLPYDYAMSSTLGVGMIPTKKSIVQVYFADPYRDINKLHAYHPRRRAWAKGEYGTDRAIAGKQRTRQVERWCRLSGLRPTVERM